MTLPSTGTSARITNDRHRPVTARREIAPGLVVLTVHAPDIAQAVKAGQFVNVLPRIAQQDPMLRRPFSVYGTDEAGHVSIIVQIHGRGTAIIADTMPGESLDMIGPLGNPWNTASGDYDTAVLLIGGVGVASMPLLTAKLTASGTPVATYYGARTRTLFALDRLTGLQLSTDDGSEGYHGHNVQLLREHLQTKDMLKRPKIFACGPTPMMRAAKTLAAEFGIPCEVSLETEMACGIGICQGCPVPTDEATFAATGKRFRLVCMDGPSFEAGGIEL